MLKKFMIITIFTLLGLSLINSVQGTLPSAEEPAIKADEIIMRRLPFTFDCDFCHSNGKANNSRIPHSTTLEYHDKLSLQNTSGCFICHDYFQRDRLRLLSGELISFKESPRLCYQCHQNKYDTWLYGDHGKSITALDLGTSNRNTSVEELEERRYRCSDFTCHNPHNPRLFKVSLGTDYPLPPPLDPPPPARFFEDSNNESYYNAVVFTGNIFLVVLVLILLISVSMMLNFKKWRRE